MPSPSPLTSPGQPARTRLAVRVTPRASRNQIVGWTGNVLGLRLSAPPVEGKANVALVKLLAKTLGISQRRIAVVRGLHDRNKKLLVEGLSIDEIRERVAGEIVSSRNPPKRKRSR